MIRRGGPSKRFKRLCIFKFIFLNITLYALVSSIWNRGKGDRSYDNNISSKLSRSDFLKFSRPKKCLRKCANKENLPPSNLKIGSCSFTGGKFSSSWNASTAADFLTCQKAILVLNQDVRQFIYKLSEIKKDYKLEKGIVFSLKRSELRLVYATIRVVREFYSSNLPIEVFVAKLDLQECEKILERSQISCKTPTFDTQNKPKSRFGWKVVAILQSSFKKVLWLDTDCIPLINPDELLENEEFGRHGAIFWPDLTGDQCNPNDVSIWPSGSSEGALWNAFNIKFDVNNWKHVQELEAGQILIDSEVFFSALKVTYFLTEHGIFQQFAYGDKEAFRWSWLLLDQNYFFAEYPALASYHSSFDQFSKQCYRLHYLHGTPVFLHGKKRSRKDSKCGYDSVHARSLKVASIIRDSSTCAQGICYNSVSFFCSEKTFFYIDNTEMVKNSVQDIEDFWEIKYVEGTFNQKKAHYPK